MPAVHRLPRWTDRSRYLSPLPKTFLANKKRFMTINVTINATNHWMKSALVLIASLACWPTCAHGQNDRCDPNKVMSSEACAKCHINETRIWKQTPHYRTFEELGRRDEAKQICFKLGLRSVKRSDVCIDCHFTAQPSNGRFKPVSGVSCESCHGAAKDWITVHNDFGGPLATRETESVEHAKERMNKSIAFGMNNTHDLYSIASNCFNCHTVPNEELVNIGGHTATSEEFELVSWSQGSIRHNFLDSAGNLEVDHDYFNAVSSPERIRVMFVVGLIADLEFSTRATSKATEKSTYGTKVANRAARAAMKLYEVQQKIQDENVQAVLASFAGAELRLNNSQSLLEIADEIRESGHRFSQHADGSRMSAIDSLLPDPTQYK